MCIWVIPKIEVWENTHLHNPPSAELAWCIRFLTLRHPVSQNPSLLASTLPPVRWQILPPLAQGPLIWENSPAQSMERASALLAVPETLLPWWPQCQAPFRSMSKHQLLLDSPILFTCLARNWVPQRLRLFCHLSIVGHDTLWLQCCLTPN